MLYIFKYSDSFILVCLKYSFTCNKMNMIIHVFSCRWETIKKSYLVLYNKAWFSYIVTDKKENDSEIVPEWNLNVKVSFQACSLPWDFRPLLICLQLFGHPLFPEICCSNLSSNSHFHSSAEKSYSTNHNNLQTNWKWNEWIWIKKFQKTKGFLHYNNYK